MSIYLIGFMGTGKTTVGKALAERMNLPVYDTDEMVIKESGTSISKIFAEKGEAFFRKMESTILKSLPEANAVITTGGGIILSEENRKWIKEHGQVIFLYTEPEEILKRVENDTSRPLLSGNKRDAIFSLYKDRLPLYEETAHICIDTTGKSIPVIIDEIFTSLN